MKLKFGNGELRFGISTNKSCFMSYILVDWVVFCEIVKTIYLVFPVISYKNCFLITVSINTQHPGYRLNSLVND